MSNAIIIIAGFFILLAIAIKIFGLAIVGPVFLTLLFFVSFIANYK